jgi:hypothetical protein
MALAVAAAMVGGPAAAQDFQGAEISAEVLGLSEAGEIGETRYGGAVEALVWDAIGIGANLSWHGFRGLDTDGTNVTLRGTYELGLAEIGVFWAHDRLEAGDGSWWGVEAAGEFAGTAIEGHLGRGFDEGGLAGIDARHGFGPFAVTGRLSTVSGQEEATRIGIGGEWSGLGPTLFGEIGRVERDGEEEAYLGLGARIGLGEPVTFGSRGGLAVAPYR